MGVPARETAPRTDNKKNKPSGMKPEESSFLLKRYFYGNGYLKVFMFGVLLILVGFILSRATGYMLPPDDDDYDDYDEYQDVYNFYSDSKTYITTTGSILEGLGLILLMVGMFIGAIVDDRVPQYVRVAMMISVGLIVAFAL